jgi:hypothetical protein
MRRIDTFNPDEMAAIQSNWQGASQGPVGWRIATSSQIGGSGRGYAPNAYGAYRFLTDLRRAAGVGGGSTTTGGRAGAARFTASAGAGATQDVTSKLNDVGNAVATFAKNSGTVGVYVGQVSIRITAERKVIPIVDRMALKRQIRRLGLPDGTNIQITVDVS